MPPRPAALYTAAYQPVAPAPNISPDPGTLAFDAPAAQPLAEASKSTLVDAGLGPPNLEAKPRSQPLRTVRASIAERRRPVCRRPPPLWQPPEGNVALGVPNYAGSNKLSLGAGLAVPVFHGLTLNLNYAAVRSYGGDVLPGLTNLDAANNSYVGGLTYTIPYSSSTLSISAYQNRYGESVLPNNNGITQTGGDLNFTVKF